MKARRFKWGTDEHGNDGWIPTWMPNAWTSDGVAFAHDILEHPPIHKEDGGVECELLALGALWWLRGESGMLAGANPYWRRSPEAMVARDVADCWREVAWENNGKTLKPQPRTLRIDDTTEHSFEEMLREARLSYVSEMGEDERDPFTMLPEDYQARTLSLLRQGYRWAQRTYRDNWRASDLFRELTEYGNENRKNGDFGEVLEIRVNERTLEFQGRLLY